MSPRLQIGELEAAYMTRSPPLPVSKGPTRRLDTQLDNKVSPSPSRSLSRLPKRKTTYTMKGGPVRRHHLSQRVITEERPDGIIPPTQSRSHYEVSESEKRAPLTHKASWPPSAAENQHQRSRANLLFQTTNRQHTKGAAEHARTPGGLHCCALSAARDGVRAASVQHLSRNSSPYSKTASAW